MFEKIQRDVAARIAVEPVNEGHDRIISDKKISALRIVWAVLTEERLWPIVVHRYYKLPVVGIFFRLLRVFIRIFLGVKLDGKIGHGFSIGHASSIFINSKVVIGRDVRVNHEVTIALRRGIPVIGDNVRISAGAKILGCNVGNNVHIGANAVVLHDVPDDSTVAGVPAKLIRLNGIKVNMALSEYWAQKTKMNNCVK